MTPKPKLNRNTDPSLTGPIPCGTALHRALQAIAQAIALQLAAQREGERSSGEIASPKAGDPPTS